MKNVSQLTALCLFAFCVLFKGHGSEHPLVKALQDQNIKTSSIWVYNDIKAAKARAKETGRPIFVTFRCVPCNACKGFDAEVTSGNKELQEFAQKNFVCVRQVEMKGVDLSQFQFDYDLNWAAMFIHPDGTVYARYGTQSAEGPDAYNSIASLKKTMQRVLKLHAEYPKNKAGLNEKKGKKKPYKTALEMPGLEHRDKYRGTTQRNNCIHCHNIHDAEQLQAHRTGTFTFEMLNRYPLPENAGLLIDPDDGQKVHRIMQGTSADKAGLARNDVITHVNGQIIASIADIQWVLHNLANQDVTLNVAVRRGDNTLEKKLALKKGWKKSDFSWRGSMWSLRPRLGVWAPPLKEQELKRFKIPEGKIAYKVKWINNNIPEGKAALKAGLRHGDLIVALAGKDLEFDHPRKFNVHIKLNYKPGGEFQFTVVRKGKRMEIKIPIPEVKY